MLETRHVEATRLDDASVVFWESHLTPAPGHPTVKLGGHHYFGLGMRFLESMDKGGRHFNADNANGELVRGDEYLTPSAWTAYTAKADGKPVTVAMFEMPGNPRPVKWFTMSTPFAYIAATINLWKEPYTLEAGKELVARYAVATWDGEVDAKTIDAMAKRVTTWTTTK
jgi:hypothetical protein